MANLLSTAITGTATTSGSVVIGGTFANNAYNSVSSTRLMFGGGNEPNNYSIGTNLENYGGNYTKLDLRWHTGIRIGAQPGYGGVRFFSNETLSTRIMSIGETDANVRIDNNLYIGGAGGWITDLLNAKYSTSGGTISGYVRINKNWAEGDFGAEQFTIYGTYPSITLRNTATNSKWLIHNSDTLNFYYGATASDNSWAKRFEIATNGNIWMEWGGWLSDLLNAKQNASTAITTSNIGSQSVNYASSAGSVAWGNVSSKPSYIMYYQGFTLDANTMDTNSTGFTYANNAPFYGPVARFSTGGGYDLWLGGSYIGGNSFFLRTRNGDAGTFNDWREIITSGNIASQSVSYASNSGALGGLSSGKYPKQDYYYSSSQDWNTIEAADTTSAIVLRIESAVANPPANDVYNWSLWQQGTRSRGSQIAVAAYGEERMYFRGSNFDSGSYNNWNEIVHSGNIGSQSVSYASSSGNSSTTSQIVFSDLKINFPSGAGGGHSFSSNHYSMGLDVGNGAWSHPHYRDIIIGYHTGIRIGANYSGIRFYNNSPTTDANNDGNGDGGEALLMTIGGYVGTANQTDVVVNNNLFANVSMRAPIFYDSNDTGYYLDPNGSSNLLTVTINNTYVGNAIYFGGGNNYLNWTSGRIYSNVGIQSENSMRAPQLRVTNSTNNAYITGNSDWGLAIVNDNGFIQFGPANNSWSHIYSDKSFYFNQDLYVNGTRVVLNSGTWGINITGSSSQSNSLAITGYGSGNMTYYQNSGTFAGYSGWAGYFISNHGDGATYYNQTIIMPFWGAPQYSRLQGGTFVGPYTFWTTENLNDYAPNMNQYVRTSDNVTFNTTTAPTILVNNHSDNTKGYRIHNTSGSSVSAMFTNSSNQLVIAAGAVDQINLNKKVYVNGVALGVNVSPSATAGRIDASNDIVAYSSSDERLKYNITPIENALDKVKSLTGVEFDWKPEYKHAHGYEGHDTGIIAQQVQEVIPSAVRTNDTGFLAVRYEKLIGLLVEGMKEQQAQIEELKAKLDGIAR